MTPFCALLSNCRIEPRCTKVRLVLQKLQSEGKFHLGLCLITKMHIEEEKKAVYRRYSLKYFLFSTGWWQHCTFCSWSSKPSLAWAGHRFLLWFQVDVIFYWSLRAWRGFCRTTQGWGWRWKATKHFQWMFGLQLTGREYAVRLGRLFVLYLNIDGIWTIFLVNEWITFVFSPLLPT